MHARTHARMYVCAHANPHARMNVRMHEHLRQATLGLSVQRVVQAGARHGAVAWSSWRTDRERGGRVERGQGRRWRHQQRDAGG